MNPTQRASHLIFPAALILGLACQACLAGQVAENAVAPVSSSSESASATTTLKGQLRSRMSIGGDTTGWAIVAYAGGRRQSTEIEFSPTLGQHPDDGALVEVTGHYASHTYVERGEVSIFVVTSVKVLPQPAPDPAQK